MLRARSVFGAIFVRAEAVEMRLEAQARPKTSTTLAILEIVRQNLKLKVETERLDAQKRPHCGQHAPSFKSRQPDLQARCVAVARSNVLPITICVSVVAWFADERN